jgi:hypothetical protein
LTETAAEIDAVDQPKACCRGSIMTPGVARNPAAPTVAINVAPATNQARWILNDRRRSAVGSSVRMVTDRSSGTGTRPDSGWNAII